MWVITALSSSYMLNVADLMWLRSYRFLMYWARRSCWFFLGGKYLSSSYTVCFPFDPFFNLGDLFSTKVEHLPSLNMFDIEMRDLLKRSLSLFNLLLRILNNHLFMWLGNKDFQLFIMVPLCHETFVLIAWIFSTDCASSYVNVASCEFFSPSVPNHFAIFFPCFEHKYHQFCIDQNYCFINHSNSDLGM